MKNPGRAIEEDAITGSAVLSENPKAVFSTTAEESCFYQKGIGLYLAKLV